MGGDERRAAGNHLGGLLAPPPDPRRRRRSGREGKMWGSVWRRRRCGGEEVKPYPLPPLWLYSKRVSDTGGGVAWRLGPPGERKYLAWGGEAERIFGNPRMRWCLCGLAPGPKRASWARDVGFPGCAVSLPELCGCNQLTTSACPSNHISLFTACTRSENESALSG